MLHWAAHQLLVMADMQWLGRNSSNEQMSHQFQSCLNILSLLWITLLYRSRLTPRDRNMPEHIASIIFTIYTEWNLHFVNIICSMIFWKSLKLSLFDAKHLAFEVYISYLVFCFWNLYKNLMVQWYTNTKVL